MSDLKALARETAENCSTDHLWHGLAAAAAGIVIRGGMACDPCILSALERVSREGEQRIRELEERNADLSRKWEESDTARAIMEALDGQTAAEDRAIAAEQRLKEAREALADYKVRKDEAYTERNRLVALVASIFPASLERHPDDDKEWEDDWRWVVYIDMPSGQASWHIHDTQLILFDHLPRFQGRRWDGHTTEQKYERIAAGLGGQLIREATARIEATQKAGDAPNGSSE